MRKQIYLISLISSFIIMGCASVRSIEHPATYRPEPNSLNKDTKVTIPGETKVSLPKGSSIKTDEITGVSVTLEEPLELSIPVQDSEGSSSSIAVVSLPKNTAINLPAGTAVKTAELITVKVESESEAILPKGTEVVISKINWYAILFYATIIVGLLLYYLSGRWQDKNNDGYEDEEPKINHNIIVNSQTYSESSTSASSVAKNIVNSSYSSNGPDNV